MRDTSSFRRYVSAILKPNSSNQIAELVRIAARERISLYPVSTGHNWGYGTMNPPVDGCVLVHLGKLKGISVDEELGLATVEPGVTQQDLWDYLAERSLPFLVPVTGAGPHCSLLGNALEGGFGLAPHADHFGAVTALEAVLPDGRMYRNTLTELGAEEVGAAFKWSLGPYLDGLFRQGAFGIVVRGTIALARRPERLIVFFFNVVETELDHCVAGVRQLLRRCGANIGGINLMNRARVQLMAPKHGNAAELLGAAELPGWAGAGAVYGPGRVVRAVCAEVQSVLRSSTTAIRFVDPKRLQIMDRVLSRLPKAILHSTRRRIRHVLPALKAFTGEPTEVALPLAYRNIARAPKPGDMDPARDGCGLYWYSPLIPMKPERVREFIRMVSNVNGRYGMSAPITLTSLSERCFDSTVPLLFDPGNPYSEAQAECCYRELFETGRAQGYLPYRIGAQHMELAVRSNLASWQLIAQLKAAIDPDQILAPGRYSPLSSYTPACVPANVRSRFV